MKTTITFYFDHAPGMSGDTVFVTHKPYGSPADGFKRYRVSVDVDDGCSVPEAVCLDAMPPVGVALTVDGSAAYTFPDK